MSTEPSAPSLPPLKISTTVITAIRPHIVIEKSDDGTEMKLKLGESRQVDLEIEESYGFEPVNETPFRVLALSRISFGGNPMSVLDEKSTPPGADYMSRIGTRVLHGFRCIQDTEMTRVHGRAVYFVHRTFIVLP